MPHQTKGSTSTAASLHSDALSTIASTASSLDARPKSPLVLIDALTGLPLLQKPGDAPVMPTCPPLPDDPVAVDHPTDFPLQDHLATAELSHPVAVVDARPDLEPKRKSPPPAPKKMTHFADGFDHPQEGQANQADALRMKSPVIVELRTNVIVKDEYSLVTELSSYISTRYQRPQGSIMISISHSSCLLYGGTFDPGYILTLSAVETYMQSATNKRNTALLQSFLSKTLNVPPQRGVVRFLPVREDCLGTGGKTVAGEIERAELDSGVVRRNVTTSVRKSVVSALKRHPTNPKVHKSTSPTGSGPKSPQHAEKRRSVLSMGRGSKEEGRLQGQDSKSKSKGVSLHPPDLSEMMDSPFSSRSSLSIPSPVYVDRVDVQPEQQSRTSGATTENLLGEATKLLSIHAAQDADRSGCAQSVPAEPRRGRTETSSNHPPPAMNEVPSEEPKEIPARDALEPNTQGAQPASKAESPQTAVHGSAGQQSSHGTKPATIVMTPTAKEPPHQPVVPLPPLPAPQPRVPKMNRRKSLLAIFKRDQPAKPVST